MAKKKLTNKARQGLLVWTYNNAKDRVPTAQHLKKFESMEVDDELYMPQILEMIRRKQLLEQVVEKRVYTKKEEPVVKKVLDLDDDN